MIIPTLILAVSQPATIHGFDVERLARIPVRMAAFAESQDVAGTVTLIQRRGKRVQWDAQGFANLNPEVPMKPDTIFQVMSMTKPVTAIAVLLCAERGLLNLDDRVEWYLPKFGDLEVFQTDGSRKRRTRPMTIRHLLTHTSGLSGDDPGGLDDDTKASLTLAEYAAKFGPDALNSEPGERIAYSGPGISAAGRIVEIVSKQNIETFLKRELFDPLGMADTYFFSPTEVYPRIAHMYFSEGGQLKAFQPNPFRTGSKFANPAGGLYSTAPDMARILQLLLDGGRWGQKRILSPRAVQALTTLQTGTLSSDGNDAQGYALGFSVVRTANGTATLRPVGSFGHTGAFCTEFWADPQTGTIAVFMSQSFSDRVRKTFNTMVNATYVGP